MTQRFIIWVNLDPETGDVTSAAVMDNERLESFPLPELHRTPLFVPDRIALMKLTDVNKSEKGEILGRKISEQVVIIYLTYDEYHQLKEECK